jgi:hypothetical protein
MQKPRHVRAFLHVPKDVDHEMVIAGQYTLANFP